eukprot:4376483-Heterocapsa_arctica.AAC.1
MMVRSSSGWPGAKRRMAARRACAMPVLAAWRRPLASSSICGARPASRMTLFKRRSVSMPP